MIDEISEEPELPRKAARRSLLCSGAGFALVGHRRLAVASLAVSWVFPLAVIWLSLQPAAAPLYAVAALFVAYAVLAGLERIAVQKGRIGRPGPRLLVERYIALSLGSLLAAAVCLIAFFASYGSVRMAGTGMSPTLEKNDRLLYYKRVDWDAIKPGAVIVFANPSDSGWGKPGWLVVSRILAGPGDKLSIEGHTYLVNGRFAGKVGGTGNDRVRLEVPVTPETMVVPDDCFFVVQDGPGFDSGVLSWVRSDSILGDRIWHLGPARFLSRVK